MSDKSGRKPSGPGARRKRPTGKHGKKDSLRKQLAQQGRRRNIDRRTAKGLVRSLPGGPRFKGDRCNAEGTLDDGTKWECPLDRAHHGLCPKHAVELIEGKAPPFSPPLLIQPRPERHDVGKRAPKGLGTYFALGDGTAWVRVIDPRKGRPDRWARIDATDIDIVGKWHITYRNGKRLRFRRWNWIVAEDPNGRTWWAIDRDSRMPMHVLLMDPAPRGQTIDHINQDGWDNRRANLRHATYEQQAANRHNPWDPKPPPLPTCPGCRHRAQVTPGIAERDNHCAACVHAAKMHRHGDNHHPKPKRRGAA